MMSLPGVPVFYTSHWGRNGFHLCSSEAVGSIVFLIQYDSQITHDRYTDRKVGFPEEEQGAKYIFRNKKCGPRKMSATETGKTSGRTTFRTRPKSPKNPQQPR